ncbi:hypothetical protein KAI46_05610 [bacterium]|nr:hypothetical protein [bacterium]
METQETSMQVSLLSRMNAFYGIPNTSQATSAAVERGAQAPEVYTPEEVETPNPQPTERAEENSAPSPVENYFAEPTEQVEISNQAVALQQSQSEDADPAAPATYAATPEAQEDSAPEVAAFANAGEAGTPTGVNQPEVPGETAPSVAEAETPRQTNNQEPAAVSALNAEPATAQANPIEAPDQGPIQPQAGYTQFDSGFGGGAAQAASGGNSNAVEPGALFSAIA